MTPTSIPRLIKSKLATTFNLPFLYQKSSFSQEGEDIILQKIFKHQKRGFYVDIGAHHPFRYSNTYLLFRKGWTGINIDCSPNVKKLFDRTRNEDINLNLAIDYFEGKKNLYVFKDGALNTLSKDMADGVVSSKQSKLVKIIKIKTQRLDNILKKYLKRRNLDLLNIDVEGLELAVLKSNNWAKYRPYIIAVENLKKDRKISNYLKKHGYTLIAETISTQIYERIK